MRGSRAGRRMALGCATLGVAAWLVMAPLAAAQSLQVTETSGVVFPSRTLVVSVPQTVSVQTSSVHVAENGRPVKGLTTVGLNQDQTGDLGVVLVIDSDPSMSGAPLSQAMVAARGLAAQRTGAQQLGVILGDGTSLPLTSSSAQISRFLAHSPRVVKRTNLLAATRLAIGELEAAHVPAAAVIYVSDDMDRAPGLTPQSLAALANGAHVRLFTVAVRDAATTRPGPADLPPGSMRQLAQSAHGTFSEAAPDQLRRTFAAIEAGLRSQYVVHYRSAQPAGATVRVTVRVDGVPGVYQSTYRAPGLPPHPRPASRVSQPSFWASSLSVAAVAVACALLLGLGLALVVSNLARAGQLQARVEPFVAQGPRIEPSSDRRARPGPLSRLLERRRWWPRFVEAVSISGLRQSPQELARWAAVVSLLSLALLDAISGSLLLGILAAALGPYLIRRVVRRSVRRQRTQFAEQLPGQLHEVASAMRTGRSITEAVAAVTEHADQPIRRELERVLLDERAGLHFDEALLPVARRMESTEIEQLALIAALHRRTGANITEVIDRIADTADQRVGIRRELATMTAQARLSRNILCALPVVAVIAFDLVGHGYEDPLFNTTPGLAFLVIGAGMVAAGAKIMKAIVNIEE